MQNRPSGCPPVLRSVATARRPSRRRDHSKVRYEHQYSQGIPRQSGLPRYVSQTWVAICICEVVRRFTLLCGSHVC